MTLKWGSLKRKAVDALDGLSSKKSFKYTTYLSAIVVFLVLILLPPIIGIIIKGGTMQQVLEDSELTARALTAIMNSFVIAFLVSALDLVAGFPMAWLITGGKSKWLN